MNERCEEMFRFRVLTAGHFPVANEWYVDGILESGEINPPTAAGVTVGDEHISISIKTVALVSAKKPQKNRFTLSIEKPEVPIEHLIGTQITGKMSCKPDEKKECCLSI